MEENVQPIAPSADSKICVNCKVAPALEGYPTPLCGDCRTRFIKYPIPKWIYAFGAGILVIMIIELANVPKYLGAAIDYSRGENAIEAHKYLTAEKNLKKVVATFPQFKNATAYLFIAACYNKDISQVGELSQKLEHETIDNDIVDKGNKAAAFVSQFIQKDSTDNSAVIQALADTAIGYEQMLSIIDSSSSQDKVSLLYMVADKLFDRKKYLECKEVLNRMKDKQPDSYLVMSLSSATDRNIGNYDAALVSCNKMLAINKEDIYAIAQKAKVELKRKNDVMAKKYANEAYSLNNKDITALEAKAMVAYFAGEKEKSSQLLAEIKENKDDSDKVVYNRTLKVLNGTDSYR